MVHENEWQQSSTKVADMRNGPDLFATRISRPTLISLVSTFISIFPCSVDAMSLPPFLTISPPPVTPPTPARLAALYASTSAQRLSNPTGYTANVQWWSGVIQELSRNGWLGSTSASSISPGGGTHQRGKEDDDGRGHGKRSHGEERGMDGEVEDEGGLQGDSGDRLVLTVDETLLARLENGEGVRPRGIGGVIVGPLPYQLK